MLRSLNAVLLFAGALCVGTVLGSSVNVASADVLGAIDATAQTASQVKEPAPDPNKKNAGDPCKSSDECQAHHTCKKVGDKNACVAPPRRELPPGAVT